MHEIKEKHKGDKNTKSELNTGQDVIIIEKYQNLVCPPLVQGGVVMRCGKVETKAWISS